MPSERRAFSGVSQSTNKSVNGTNSQVSQKIKNFFRINSLSSKDGLVAPEKTSSEKPSDGTGTSTPRSEHKIRNSRFLPHIGRNRSQTVASEGNALDEMSPTAHANPYFIHQGLPALRHHNDNSVPPSPPDTPVKKHQANGSDEAALAAGKEELARKLRRVASAPNAQGMFTTSNANDNRPQTSDLDQPPSLALQQTNTSVQSMVETVPLSSSPDLLLIPGVNGIPSPGKIRNAAAFRRTYSSNSIKVRDVQVGPGSFDKIKLIGKGDVGKVYLVREKKSARLYAMKGELMTMHQQPARQCADFS